MFCVRIRTSVDNAKVVLKESRDLQVLIDSEREEFLLKCSHYLVLGCFSVSVCECECVLLK